MKKGPVKFSTAQTSSAALLELFSIALIRRKGSVPKKLTNVCMIFTARRKKPFWESRNRIDKKRKKSHEVENRLRHLV